MPETQVNLPDECLGWLSDNVEEELRKFDPETGRFTEQNGGWAVTHQDIMLTLAYLFMEKHESNRFYGDEQIFAMIGKAGDALRSFQHPDGKVEFVKVDGSRWGPIYMPWSMYHWVETFHRIEAVLPADRRESWSTGLELAYEGICGEMRQSLDRYSQKAEQGPVSPDSVVHNIPVWNAMGLHRASQVFGRPEWKRTAEEMIRLAVQGQDPAGFWPEHKGPTTLYNIIYVHALGLYHRHRHQGEIDVTTALRNALRFHEIFSYPDGSMVETIDGRVKFHAHPSPSGLVGLSLFPEGRSLAVRFARLAKGQGQKWRSPHFSELLRYWNQGEGATPRPSLFEQESIRCRQGNAFVRKDLGWYVCLSGYTSPATESRWGQDRQSFVGVWQRDAGLIIGGGNSKEQPEWSTFEVSGPNGAHAYIPHDGKADETSQQIELQVAEARCRVRLSQLEDDRLILQFDADLQGEQKAQVNVPLKLQENGKLSADDGKEEILCDKTLAWEFGQGAHRLNYNGWTLELEGPFQLKWPSLPFNPYQKEGKSDLGEAVAIMTFGLEDGAAKRLVLEVGHINDTGRIQL